ncbi:hypothetical protein C2845_PM03G16960 [Panicum miliaceum]|uniref:Uncharacterized protein n=1 Tax=Panicum miliaceum TaxID=4540 RepID=A0A3L6TH35_PANMI|nr:hypothetical protein C2845_PM03G16960 [Panicum miliaceum]
MDSMRDVRMSDPKIDKATNKMTIVSRISKGFAIRGTQMNTKLHRYLICESGTREKIMNILLLGQVDAIRRGRDLKTKKVMERTEIRHQELIAEALLHKVNELRVITGNDHVINIEEKKRAPTRRSMDKESKIMVTWLEASISDNRGEVLKPGPRSLLEAVKRSTQPTDQAIRDRITRGWLHIDLLLPFSIKKSILNIKLGDGPPPHRSNNKKSPDSGHVSNRSKSLIIVTTMLLLETTHHKTSLVALKRAIRSSLNLIDPLASNRSGMRWQGDKIPNTGALQGSNLLRHSVLPVRMDSSLTVSGRLNKRSNSEAIALWRA